MQLQQLRPHSNPVGCVPFCSPLFVCILRGALVLVSYSEWQNRRSALFAPLASSCLRRERERASSNLGIVKIGNASPPPWYPLCYQLILHTGTVHVSIPCHRRRRRRRHRCGFSFRLAPCRHAPADLVVVRFLRRSVRPMVVPSTSWLHKGAQNHTRSVPTCTGAKLVLYSTTRCSHQALTL